MIPLAELIEAFRPDLEAKYGDLLLPSHRQALAAIQRCHTEASGRIVVHCHDCEEHAVFALSCGHRFCPQCQHEAGEAWIERQRAKRLPADYYLLTFTLPEALRPLVYDHQRETYGLLLSLVWQTLAQFGRNDKALQGDLGATAVLHTHTRALDFHPHVHVVIPAGAFDPKAREWRTKSGRFLFSHKALAKVFRAKWLASMAERGWRVKARLPDKWVVDCKQVGNGDKALIYLGRYLYRGVLPEKNILRCENGQVTFRYTDNQRRTRTRTLAGADFLWLLLKHVLPKSFRRSRDYGFLHGNRKQLIQLLHLVLRVIAPPRRPKVPRCCHECGGTVRLTVIPFLPWPKTPPPVAAGSAAM
jgi:hypothetical protein